MKLYKLQYNIDGYTSKHEPPAFFYNFDDAKKAIEKIPGVYMYGNEWYIEGCKRTEIQEREDEISLLAIIFTGEEKDEWSINWGRVNLFPVEINESELSNDRVYELYKRKGYNSWMFNGMDGVGDSDMYFDEGCLEISGSKNHIRRLARIKYKNLARLWNDKEYKEKCSVVSGGGEDYLTIGEYHVK